jgi:hypothetical protein
VVRAWLVFFGPAPPGWWSLLCRKPFQHVAAIGYDPDLDVWLSFDPRRDRLILEVLRPGPEIDRRLGEFAHTCDPHVLRFTPRNDRRMSPAFFSCVGAVKALLGIRSCALVPAQLYRDLVRNGAEIVDVPKPEAALVDVQNASGATNSAGRSGNQTDAPAGAGPGRARTYQVDPGLTCAGDHAA